MTERTLAERRAWLDKMMRKVQKDRDIVTAPPWRANQTVLAKEIAVQLTRRYPGRQWAVGFPDYKPGSVFIRDLNLASQYFLHIRLADVDMPELRNVMRLVGEMLERFNASRSRRFGADDYNELHHRHRTPGGLLIPDLTNVPNKNLVY